MQVTGLLYGRGAGYLPQPREDFPDNENQSDPRWLWSAAGENDVLVDVSVDFEVSQELATFRVLVPDGEGEKAAQELAVARARDLARKFAAAG